MINSKVAHIKRK